MVNGKRDISNNIEHLVKEFAIINGKGDDNIEGEVKATDSKPTYKVPDTIKTDRN